MSQGPRVPDWIRQFRYRDWTNVFHLVPNNEHLYPVALRSDWKPQFNDWKGRILLLAKDGCPPDIILERVAKGEPHAWRYGQFGEKGSRTNERLYRFASKIPGGKLYGSAAANMLCNVPGMSRELKGFESAPLQDFLRRVLRWVLQSMENVEWVACLGQESWSLTCSTLGNFSAANQFKEYRDSYKHVAGVVGTKKITAFPLFHPAALGDAINDMEKGWQEFRAVLATPRTAALDRAALPLPVSQGNAKRHYGPKNSPPKHRHTVTATLPRRQCRVEFIIGAKVVHRSPEYNSGNTWANIIRFARSKRGGAPAKLPRTAVAAPQILTARGWINSND